MATIFALCSVLIFGPTGTSVPQAFGHGLSSDEALAASIGDRLATVRVEMRPPILLAEAPEDATIEMQFFDKATGDPILHVTYFITLKKGDTVLMRDWFHAHDGDLFIKIRPKDRPNLMINAPKEPILGGWVGSKDSPVLAEGRIFLEGGLYHFAIEIFSIDFDKTILDPPVKYDAYISIGETVSYSVTDGAEDEIAIRTYYDKIRDFEYDEEGKLVKFSMPLTWDKDYLNQVPLVHEEVVIPRSLASLIADEYTGTVNGIRLPKGAVMADTTNPDQVIVHYMIPNQQLLQLADHIQAMSGDPTTAEFVLTPGAAEIGMPIGGDTEGGMMMGGQSMAMSNNGIYHAMLSTSPAVIEPGQLTSYAISLMDARSGAMLDVSYEFVITKDGGELLRRSGNTIGGTAAEQFTFVESQTGPATLRLEKINKSDEFVEFGIMVGGSMPGTMPPPGTTLPPPAKEVNVSLAMKQTKKLTLVAVKNNDDVPIYGVKMNLEDGDIRFVKAKAKLWDRERIDQSTVMVSTQDKPLMPGRTLIILLLGNNPTSPLGWEMLDENTGSLGTGVTEPRLRK